MSTNKQDERRKAERRTGKAEASGMEQPGVVEQGTVGEAMVDALEDILKWERASERAIRVAQVDSTSDLTQS